MTVEQALAILTQVTEAYQGTAQDHRNLAEAIRVLTPAEKEEVEEEK